MLPTESQRRMTEPRGSINGRDMLRQLMKLQDTAAIIVKISPIDCRLSNGLDRLLLCSSRIQGWK